MSVSFIVQCCSTGMMYSAEQHSYLPYVYHSIDCCEFSIKDTFIENVVDDIISDSVKRLFKGWLEKSLSLH